VPPGEEGRCVVHAATNLKIQLADGKCCGEITSKRKMVVNFNLSAEFCARWAWNYFKKPAGLAAIAPVRRSDVLQRPERRRRKNLRRPRRGYWSFGLQPVFIDS